MRPPRYCEYKACYDVSIHAPGRGATRSEGKNCPSSLCFNSRTREGCDANQAALQRMREQFQFTHPGGVRLRSPRLCSPLCGFNSRTREGCDPTRLLPLSLISCFNSRTREGCDWRCPWLFRTKVCVSIHAPGRGATYTRCLYSTFSRRFNSRTREGCDRAERSWSIFPAAVSIHAPGRGATCRYCRLR